MGVMRFHVYPRELVQDWPEASRAFISGFDGRIYPTRVEFDGAIMTCRRPHSDSGKLHVAWPVVGFGRPVLSTASLPEREEPYLLPLELARGKIVEIRDQSAGWAMLRMEIPPAFEVKQKQAFRKFSQASAAQQTPAIAARLASEALTFACEAAELLASAYVEQRLTNQRQLANHPPALVGCDLGFGVPSVQHHHLLRRTFDSAVVPIEWRHIEPTEGEYTWDACDQLITACIQDRMIVRGGPFIRLTQNGMPSWLDQWSHDFLNLQSFVCDFVETAISRYMGRIRIWEVSAYGNTGDGSNLSEEQRLALVARTLETAIRTDADSQFFIRIDRPWGEYQAAGQHRLSPFQFVDALVRSNLGLSGVNLEIAVGYLPNGTGFRDALGFSRLIDVWSQLGIQIHVTLAFPSCDRADSFANPHVRVDRPQWKAPWSPQAQADWLNEFLPLLIAKPAVTGVYWGHFQDRVPHDYPHSGLIAADGTVKPAFDVIRLHHAIHPFDNDTDLEMPSLSP
ncbi:MAG: endo-1,4-beta-xylanase [Maioricimonas sp. JB049]